MRPDGTSQNFDYTVGASETGHEFDFRGFTLGQLEVLGVSVTSAAGAGACDVVNNTQ
jgi:hypothetical protein